MNDLLTRDRRTSRLPESLSADQLLQAQVQIARRQLATAREALIAARRRVVALEDAVENWQQLASGTAHRVSQ